MGCILLAPTFSFMVSASSREFMMTGNKWNCSKSYGLYFVSAYLFLHGFSQFSRIHDDWKQMELLILGTFRLCLIKIHEKRETFTGNEVPPGEGVVIPTILT